MRAILDDYVAGCVGLEPGVYSPPGRPATVTGKGRVTLENGAGGRLSLELEGRSEQTKTNGAQLLDESTVYEGNTSGLTGEIFKGKGQCKMASEYIAIDGKATCKAYNGDYSVHKLAVYDGDKKFIANLEYNRSEITIDNPKAKYIIAVIQRASGIISDVSEIRLAKVMINAGMTALPWQPYTGGLISPSPDFPQPILSSGGEEGDCYRTDIRISNAKGQDQTAAVRHWRPMRGIGNHNDRLCKKDGVWGIERRYGSFKLGNMAWYDHWNEPYHVDGTFIAHTTSFNHLYTQAGTSYIDALVRCTHLLALGMSILNYPNIQFQTGQGNKINLSVRVPDTIANSVTDLKKWMTDNDVEIIFPISEPEWEPLDDASQAALNALKACRGDTIIEVDSGEIPVTIKAEYVKKKGR